MRMWSRFLALAALCCLAIADEKALPDSTSAAENTGTQIKCPPSTDYKIFQRQGESFVEIKASTLLRPEADREMSGSSVTDHQPGPDVPEFEDTTERNIVNVQNSSERENDELVNSSHQKPEQERLPDRTDLQGPEKNGTEPQEKEDNEQKPEQERRPDRTDLQKPEQDRTEPQEKEDNEQKSEQERRDSAGETQNTTDEKDLDNSTDAATTTMPSTTQEPTAVTTEDPNWCRRHGYVTPWPHCMEEAERNDTKNLPEELTKFSFRLFHQVLKKDRTANVIFSPLSIAMVLSQLLLGARGEMKDNLLDTLFDLKSSASDCVHSTLGSMVNSQGFKSASGMFYQKDLTMNAFFLNQSEELYKVTPQPLTESSSANLEMINNWVAKNTNNKIKKLLDEIPPDVKLLLLNAIFFQGKWKTKFNPKETMQQTFWGISKKVPMMTSKKYPLVSVSDAILKARVARFPLSDDMSMLIFLPHFGQLPLTEMEDKFTADVLQAILGKLGRSHVNPHMVSLPKFKVDSAQDLLSLFSNVGLSALLGISNLCGISDSDDLRVSGGQHRALLQMDETGVVAAAATSVSLARTAYVFDVRHPFIFVVWSERSRIPVMMGRIADPKA